MCKRLMLLVCVVGMLGFVSIVSADEVVWTALGHPDASFCNPDNWDCACVPGPGDVVVIEPAGPNPTRGPIVDCVVVIDSVRGGPGGDMAMDWVSGGGMTVNDWDETWGAEGDGVATFNFLGGYLTILEGRFRIANENSDVVFNISGDFELNVPEEFRFGDSDDVFVTWTQDGGTINVPEGDLQLGDDCEGTMDFTGGTLDIGENFRLIGRKKDQTINYGGTTDMYIDGDLRIGENAGEDDAATVKFNMTGGTIDADKVNTNDDASGDDGVVEINLSGGLLIARDEFKVNETDGATAVNITGGVLECGDIELDDDDSVVDVNGGVIIIDGDKTAKVAGYGFEGKLTGKGSVRGLGFDYDVTNPGKTTVYAKEYNPCLAWGPTPADGATGVVVDVLLEWQPGDYLGGRGRHALYFGEDRDQVCDSNWVGIPEPPLAFILVPFSSYDISPLGLELWKTYYWRVDEHGEAPYPYCRGECWSFTTGCELIDGDLNLDCVVNFTDYALEAAAMGDEAFFP